MEHFALIQEWKMDPSKQWAKMFPCVHAQQLNNMNNLGVNSSLQSSIDGPLKSNLRRSVDKGGITTLSKRVKISEKPGKPVQQAQPIVKQKKQNIKSLGKISDKAIAPKPTPLHKGLVKKANHVAKQEAGLLNDPRIKEADSSGDEVDFTSSESMPNKSSK